jgi:hypothetical protein
MFGGEKVDKQKLEVIVEKVIEILKQENLTYSECVRVLSVVDLEAKGQARL